MHIKEIPNAIRVGSIAESTRKYGGSKHVLYDYKLTADIDFNFPKDLKKKHVSMVYIMVVNGVVYKIGQSSCKSGIDGCMSFYFSAGQDDPGINRFGINALIRKEMEEGRMVEIYMIYMEPIVVKTPTLFGEAEIVTPVSAKGMESECLKEYFEREGSYPVWNFQERNEPLPSWIHKTFGQYKIDRAA